MSKLLGEYIFRRLRNRERAAVDVVSGSGCAGNNERTPGSSLQLEVKGTRTQVIWAVDDGEDA